MTLNNALHLSLLEQVLHINTGRPATTDNLLRTMQHEFDVNEHVPCTCKLNKARSLSASAAKS